MCDTEWPSRKDPPEVLENTFVLKKSVNLVSKRSLSVFQCAFVGLLVRLPLCLGPFLASCVLWGSSERRWPLPLCCGWPMRRQSAEGALWLSYDLRGHHPEQGLCPSLPVTASGPHCPWLGASLVFFQPLPGL